MIIKNASNMKPFEKRHKVKHTCSSQSPTENLPNVNYQNLSYNEKPRKGKIKKNSRFIPIIFSNISLSYLLGNLDHEHVKNISLNTTQ